MATKEYYREWRKKHPHYYRDYFRNNPDKRKKNNEQVRAWFKKNPDYLKDWFKNNPTKNYKNYSEEQKKRNNRSVARWFKNNPEYLKEYRKRPGELKKHIARQLFNQAIAKGVLIRQFCEIMDCKSIGHGHHDDYDKPYDVKWLCRLHHKRYHTNLLTQNKKLT